MASSLARLRLCVTKCAASTVRMYRVGTRIARVRASSLLIVLD